MVNALSAYTRGFLTQTNFSRTDEAGEKSAKLPEKSDHARGTVIKDTVEISAEARKLAQAEQAKNALRDAKVSYFEQFRPTREGFFSRNLALGIVDPSAQPFSQNRPFDEVAQAARENMDSKYQQMRESGEPYGTDNFEGKETYSLMGDLDRRALYAVASNEGGHFSKEEQQTAKDLMLGQQGMAMGLYNGPTRLDGVYTITQATSNADHMQKYAAGIQYMDQVSTEEKATSVDWAQQRGRMQYNYERLSRDSGITPQNHNIYHPAANFIFGALESYFGFANDADIGSRKDLLNEPWFEGYRDRLGSVMAETRDLYGLNDL